MLGFELASSAEQRCRRHGLNWTLISCQASGTPQLRYSRSKVAADAMLRQRPRQRDSTAMLRQAALSFSLRPSLQLVLPQLVLPLQL